MTAKVSIVISSHNRLPLVRRTFWAIAQRKPSLLTEVVVVDDGSDEDILSELKLYGSSFLWKFVRFDAAEFESKTGLKKFHNNPCVTNNIGFRHATGDLIFQQGNEVIAWGDVYEKLIADIPDGAEHWMVMSTTYDIPQQYIDFIGPVGANLTPALVRACSQWPLQSSSYRSDVTNYISLAPRKVWEALNGYDERYYAGISSEDSDFVRRARLLPNFKMAISEGVSLHQFHSGKTCYYAPPPSVITSEKWEEGCDINHKIYHSWDTTAKNHTPWPTGTYGVKEVITNGSV